MPGGFLVPLVAIFISVAVASGALVFYALTARGFTRKRLQGMAPGMSAEVEAIPISQLEAPSAPWVKHLRTLVPKSPQQASRIQRRMMNAGFRSPAAGVVYSLSEILLPVLAAVVTVAVAGFNNPTGWIAAFCVGVIAYFIPGLVLERKIFLRKKQIRNGLPDALDLLIVCLEAGSAMDQALLRVSEDLDIAYPALAEELRLILTETRAGKSRLEAFKNFAARTQVPEVRALVAMLVQTDRFGTSLGQALRTHAETSRTKRRQNAEERAAKLGVKLVIPLVFFLFPALYVVVLGPMVIRIMRVMFRGGGI